MRFRLWAVVVVGVGLVVAGVFIVGRSLLDGGERVVPGDPAGSGVVAERAVARPAEQLWSSAGSADRRSEWSQVGVGDEVAVVTAAGGHHGFDVSSGELRWRIPLAVAQMPVFVGGGLLIAPAGGELVAFDLADGGRRWTWREEAGTRRDAQPVALAVEHGIVFIAISDEVLVAVDAATGGEVWRVGVRTDLEGSLMRIVGAAGGLVHLWVSRPAGASGPAVTRHLVALDRASGRPAWERDAPAAPAVGDDQLFLAEPGLVTIVEPASGEVVRSIEVPFDPPDDEVHARNVSERPWLRAHGGLLLATLDGELIAVEHRSGQVRWSLDAAHRRVVSADGSTLHVTTPSEVLAIDLDTGAVRDRIDRAGHDLVHVAAGPDGAIVAVAADGTVFGLAHGEVAWHQAAISPAAVAPRTLPGRRIVVPLGDGVNVTGADDGTVVWEERFEGNHRVFSRLEPRIGVSRDSVYVVRPETTPDGAIGAAVLAALDAETGEHRWQHTLDAAAFEVTSGPVALDGSVFLGTTEGLWAVNAGSGRPNYYISTQGLRVEARGAVTHIAARDDSLVFAVGPSQAPLTGPGRDAADDPSRRLPAGQSLIVSADPASGQLNWQTHTTAGACGPITIADRTILVPTVAGLTALDLSTGHQRWEHPTEPPSCRASAATASTVITTDSTSSVHALDLATGQPRWTTDIQTTIFAAPVIAGDGILIATGDEVVDLSLEQGTARWRHPLDGPIHAPLVVAGDILISADSTGRLSGHR